MAAPTQQTRAMSFFGGGQQQQTGPSPVAMAKLEAEVLTDMFNKMAQGCFRKCVTSYHDGELSVGEMTCTDRCVGKYIEAQEKVGAQLQAFEQQMKAQEQMGVKLHQPHAFGPGSK